MASRVAPRVLALGRGSGRRFVSSATSSLPKETQAAIEREASLPAADPDSSSATAALTGSHMPYMVATYARPPPVFTKAKGCHIWDIENRRYLDFTSGIAVNALGHCDEGMAQIMSDQSRTLLHASNLYHNPWTGELSKLIVQKTKEAGAMKDASKVFVCNSGSEANEAAIKFCRKVGKVVDPSGEKYEIVSFHNSFHGRTMGSLSATPNPKYQKPFSPMVPGFKYGNLNDVSAINDLVTKSTCGVIVEPIQGEGGINTASVEFLTALRARCNEVGAVLVYDEIQCGLSRTGDFWAHQALPQTAHPDILTTAKALGNGYPVGATMVTEDIASKIVVGDHGTTFGGNPLASRIGHYTVSRLADPALQQNVLKQSQLFVNKFKQWQSKYPELVGETRGRGLILGLQMLQDPTALLKATRERGLLIITCGTNTLRFVPPLVISEGETEEGLDILERSIEAVFA